MVSPSTSLDTWAHRERRHTAGQKRLVTLPNPCMFLWLICPGCRAGRRKQREGRSQRAKHLSLTFHSCRVFCDDPVVRGATWQASASRADKQACIRAGGDEQQPKAH